MKGIVAYDSVHGSTKAAAEAIAEEIRSEGHEAQIIYVKEWSKGPLTGDFLLIGSPTRGGKMTKEAKEFIDSLDPGYWKGKKVVTFDTVGPLSKDAEKRRQTLASLNDKNAAGKMKEALESRGIGVERMMHFAVVGMWGPLAPDGPEMAKEQTKGFLAGLH
jgi:flavodoxin